MRRHGRSNAHSAGRSSYGSSQNRTQGAGTHQGSEATSGHHRRADRKLILATTTSTADSGLLDYILPDFEKKFNAKVDVVAVGTGQALEIGGKGDADVLLVHSRKGEDQFVTGRHTPSSATM